jgi:ribosomal protein S18 acetylase RimI-like enzyme
LRVLEVQTRPDLERCYPVMKELRQHLSLEEFISIYFEAHSADGYELIAIENEGKIQAVMGYRFLTDYVRGRHLYIDDLVSTQSARSQGFGAELLKIAETIAEDNEIKHLRLCAVLENERGIKFYEKNGWTKRAYAFSKTAPGPVEH